MTIIKSAEIPYLSEDIIEKYSNVIVKSVDGLMMKMNALMLCTISPSLKNALLEFDDFHGDHIITTEFSLEELKQVKYYYTKGSSAAMTESIMKSFGLLKPLTVSLKREEKWIENEFIKINLKKKHSTFILSDSKPVITNYDNSLVPTIIPVKNEIIDIKDELLENLEFDFASGYSSDDSHPLSNYAKTVNKKGGKRQKTTTKDTDDDWKPEILTKNYKKLSKAQGKSRQKSNNFEFVDNDLKPEKPKSNGRPWPYAHIHTWSDNDLDLFKNFELPKPLQEYASKPIKFDQRRFDKSMNDENRHFQCCQCEMKFASSYTLNAHEIKFHNEHFQCPSCDIAKNVEDAEEFKKHLFEHISMDHVQVKCR